MRMDAADVLPGTLDVLVLKAVSGGPAHGFGIYRWLERITDGRLQVEEGALYPALHRLERRGWLVAHWGVSDNNRRAKYYRLTPRGRRALLAETARVHTSIAAVQRVLAAPV
jgi:PadR family transcriptional regulator PadR